MTDLTDEIAKSYDQRHDGQATFTAAMLYEIAERPETDRQDLRTLYRAAAWLVADAGLTKLAARLHHLADNAPQIGDDAH